MEFTVSKADLVRELALSQGVVEKKATLPVLSNVLLEAADDAVTISATDLELNIRCLAPAHVSAPGGGTLPAKKLLDYVRLLPDEEIRVKFSDTHWATLTCGRSKTRIAGMPRDSYPEMPEMPEPLAQLPVGLLVSMIKKTIFSIAAEESRFTLNGALLLLKPSTLTMVSTDGHRLALVEYPNPVEVTGEHRALIPRKAMQELERLAADAAEEGAALDFAMDDNHLYFRLGRRLLSGRKLAGNFPDYERVLPKTHAHTVTLEREEFRAAIERVSQFSDERSRAVKIRFGDNEATIHSSLSESGESEESLPVDYAGPTTEIGFNATYLLDFLKATSERQVQFHFKDPQSAGELTPAGEDTGYRYRYVVMPMRI
ncbi:MAG: DNA polymerase III subunit beta [Bryobacteraceae bacterium]